MSDLRPLSGHHRRQMRYSVDWLTPPDLLARLGPFDLDPCTPLVMPWPTAAQRYTIEDNGLKQAWSGRVWLNPPYGPETPRWLRRLAVHGNGIALIFAATETAAFFRLVWDRADAVLFLKGRLFFCRPDGTPAPHNSGGPSCLVAYGADNRTALERSSLDGILIDPSQGVRTGSAHRPECLWNQPAARGPRSLLDAMEERETAESKGRQD